MKNRFLVAASVLLLLTALTVLSHVSGNRSRAVKQVLASESGPINVCRPNANPPCDPSLRAQ